MNNLVKILAVVVIVVLAAAAVWWRHSYAPDFVSKGDLIKVTSPLPGDTVSSPLRVEGEARGNWFFEASFPLVLVDWDGRIIAQSFATAQGEWMTAGYVLFEGTVEFNSPVFPDAGEGHFSRRGAVIFQKDNPSGLPEHDNALEIPIVFE